MSSPRPRSASGSGGSVVREEELEGGPEPPAAPDGVRSWLVKNLSFFWLHYTYFFLLGFIGGFLIWMLEGRRFSFVDAWFLGVSGCTITGLLVQDISAFTTASQVTIFFLYIVGGHVSLSVVPVLIRRYYFHRGVEQALPEDPTRRRQLLNETSVEYRALGCILKIVFFYHLGTQLLLALCWTLYVRSSAGTAVREIIEQEGASPIWWSWFVAFSSFSNAGFSVIPGNMIPFAENEAVLLPSATAILMGNIAYPVFMRMIAYTMSKCSFADQEAYQYLLDRPRKCFTHMFSAWHTKMLAAVIVLLTTVEVAFFMGLNSHLDHFAQFSVRKRLLMGWFQGLCTRNAGFSVIDFSEVHITMALVYLILGYIGVFPFMLLERRTGKPAQSLAPPPGGTEDVDGVPASIARSGSYGSSVWPYDIAAHTSHRYSTLGRQGGVRNRFDVLRERSGHSAYALPTPGGDVRGFGVPRVILSRAGSYEEHEIGLEPAGDTTSPSRPIALAPQVYFIAARDMFWLVMVWLAIAVAEMSVLQDDRETTMFAVFFEIVAAYANVGYSLGHPATQLSLCDRFGTFSKLLLMLIMLAGRHRGLPFSIDEAIYLPNLLNTARPSPAVDPSTLDVASSFSFHLLRRMRSNRPTVFNIFGADVASERDGSASRRSVELASPRQPKSEPGGHDHGGRVQPWYISAEEGSAEDEVGHTGMSARSERTFSPTEDQHSVQLDSERDAEVSEKNNERHGGEEAE